MTSRSVRKALAAALMGFVATSAFGLQPPPPDPELIRLDQTVQRLREEIIRLNLEAQAVEDDLLYPRASRASFLLGVARSRLLVSNITLQIDNRPAVPYSFEQDEAASLVRSGGLQRVMRANLEPGTHRLSLKVEGRFEDDKVDTEPFVAEYQGEIVKGLQPLQVEIMIEPLARRGTFSSRRVGLNVRSLQATTP